MDEIKRFEEEYGVTFYDGEEPEEQPEEEIIYETGGGRYDKTE